MDMAKMEAAIKLHEPVMRDRYGYVTTEPAESKHVRCEECGKTVSKSGCLTWAKANGTVA